MATPYATRLSEEYETRLNNIKKSNGYNTDIIKVGIGGMRPFRQVDVPEILIWISNIDSNPKLHQLTEYIAYIWVMVYDVSYLDDGYQELSDLLIQDVITALHRKDSAPLVADDIDHYLNGMVDALSIRNVTYINEGEAENPYIGALIQTACTYNRPNGVF